MLNETRDAKGVKRKGEFEDGLGEDSDDDGLYERILNVEDGGDPFNPKNRNKGKVDYRSDFQKAYMPDEENFGDDISAIYASEKQSGAASKPDWLIKYEED